MKQFLQPFPHDDGAPASWEDNRLLKEANKEQAALSSETKQYAKMLTSILK